MKASEIREKTKEELAAELLALQKEQFNLRMQKGNAESAPSMHSFKRVRRSIARVKTILNEKAREGNERKD